MDRPRSYREGCTVDLRGGFHGNPDDRVGHELVPGAWRRRERAGGNFVASSLAERFSRSLPAWSRVSSAWRLVALLIFGRANSQSAANHHLADHLAGDAGGEKIKNGRKA